MWEPQERVDLTLNTESNDRQVGIHSQEQIKEDSKRTQKEEVGTRETHIVECLLKTGPSPSRVLSEGEPDIYYRKAIDQGLLLKLTFTKRFTDNYKT